MIKPHIAALHTVVCSNHFKYERPTNARPVPTLYLKGYESDTNEVKPLRRVLKRVVNWETSVKPSKKRKEKKRKKNTQAVKKNCSSIMYSYCVMKIEQCVRNASEFFN